MKTNKTAPWVLCGWLWAALVSCGLMQPAWSQSSGGGGGTSCDPTRASCVPAGGGSGCTPLQQALGQCSAGGGGSGGGGGVCTVPGGGGNTGCGGGGAASQGGGSGGGTQVGGGNPINLINGNKHQEESDLAPLPGVLGLEFKRYYNSDSRQRGLTGVGWRSTYETVLVDLGRSIQIVQSDGRRLEFARGVGAQARLCTSTSLSDGQVRIEELPGGKLQYHWRWSDGRVLSFGGGAGSGQPLQAITAASGERVTLLYTPLGDLLDVRDPQGRRLSFIYGKPAGGQRAPLLAIDTPLGRIAYRHDEMGRLLDVRHAADAQAAPHRIRSYHYEAGRQAGNPFALTGISAAGTDSAGKPQPEQRLSTYAYDAQGRGVLSTKGEPMRREGGKVVEGTGIDQIEVEYATAPQWLQPRLVDGEARPTQLGRTIVTNAQGGKTEVLSAVIGGQYRLIQMRGAGCSTCGPVDRSYGWDAGGRLVRVTTLDAQGRPVTSEIRQYDLYGRLARLGVRMHDAQGQAQAVRWAERHEYTDIRFPDGSVAVAAQPAVIARPSVVAGREHVLRIDYNDAWQPVKVSESGFTPFDDRGEAEPKPIERTTRYTYSRINGRSVLTQIDGPLANGPKADPSDSDVTVLGWDAQAKFVTTLQQPGRLVTRIERDAAGRRIRVDGDDGFRQLRTDTAYAPAPDAAQPVAIERNAWLLRDGRADEASRLHRRVMQAVLDTLGRRSGITDADGASLTLESDLAGRPLVLADAEGNHQRWRYDARGRLLAQLTTDAADHPVDGQMWLRSDDGRLRAVLGLQGIEHVQAYLDDAAEPLSRKATDATRASQAAEAPAQAAEAPADATWRDDFGRIVREAHPQDGTVTTWFDNPPEGARQQRRRVGTDGHSATLEVLLLDTAGRLVSRQRAGCTDRLQYEGRLLVRLEGCGLAQRFERNALGEIVEHVQAFAEERGAVEFRTRYHYDADGRLVRRELPAGQVLDYDADAAGRTRAVQVERGWIVWLRARGFEAVSSAAVRWLPGGWTRTALVDGARYRPFDATPQAIAGWRHGDGGVQQWSPDAPVRRNGAHAPRRADEAGVPASADVWGRQTLHVPDGGPNQGRRQRLHWNEADQLVQVDDADTGRPVVRYGYDATGNRVTRTRFDANGTPTKSLFLYDTNHRLVAEAAQDGRIVQQYLYADHRAHTVLDGEGRAHAVHTDWRGLPVRVNDAQGASVWQATATAWGDLTPTAQPHAPAMPLRLAGQQYDAETGLHYNVQRYYDPSRGRYLSPDPLGQPDGPSRYAYLNGRPLRGIDPLGLFEIPAKFFSGDPFNTLYDVSGPDEGHGDIVRIAFAQYQQENGIRFSNQFIDWVIRNNYHTDANGGGCYALPFTVGGGQCNTKNHWDNPNDGPMYVDAGSGGFGGRTLMPSYSDGKDDNWIQDALNQVNANRNSYQDAVFAPKGGADISFILSAFGQNTHTLADFYAHTNWVDDATRGGCVTNKAFGTTEQGYVPIGLAQTRVWDEDFDAISMSSLYSGTVAGMNRFCTGITGDISCTGDKTTHGYWNKDSDSTLGGSQPVSVPGMSRWEVETYNPASPPSGAFGTAWFADPGVNQSALKAGDRVYVVKPITTMHQLAFNLAVEATKREIAKLYDGSASVTIGSFTLRDIFIMDKATMDADHIVYDTRHTKQ